eukprot:gene13646-15035_t
MSTTNPIIQSSVLLVEDNYPLVESAGVVKENSEANKPKSKAKTRKSKTKVDEEKDNTDENPSVEKAKSKAQPKPKPKSNANTDAVNSSGLIEEKDAEEESKPKTKAPANVQAKSKGTGNNPSSSEPKSSKPQKSSTNTANNPASPPTTTTTPPPVATRGRNRNLLHCLYYQIFYSPLAKKYFKVLVFQAIPVLIAAAFSGFAMSLISYIADDEEEGDRVDNECLQAFAYSLITYISGYFLTIRLKQALEQQEQSSWIVWLEQRQLTGIIFGIFAESSGFAWREFVNTFVLKIIYLRYGWGEALGAWLLMIVVFATFSASSGIIMNHFRFPSSYKELLIEYNADSFALPLAFSITVLWAVGCDLLGENYVDQTGYLFEWKDDDSDESSFVMNPYYYAYVLCISFLVSLLLVAEDRFCLPWFHQAESRIEAEDPRQHSETMIPFDQALEEGWNSFDDRTTFLQKDVSQVEAVIEMWHGFLGCMVGVAYYAMIMDGYMSTDNDFVGVVVSLFFALVLTWRGPACVAHAAYKQKIYQEEYLKEKQRNEQQGGGRQGKDGK